MRVLRLRAKPARRAAVAAPIAVAVLALSMAGCASSNSQSSYGSHVRGPQVAQSDAHGARVEIEDDGLPVQSPPVTPPRALPDDPREPFSPNYGGPSAPSPARAPAPPQKTATARPALPDDLPADFRRRLRVAGAD